MRVLTNTVKGFIKPNITISCCLQLLLTLLKKEVQGSLYLETSESMEVNFWIDIKKKGVKFNNFSSVTMSHQIYFFAVAGKKLIRKWYCYLRAEVLIFNWLLLCDDDGNRISWIGKWCTTCSCSHWSGSAHWDQAVLEAFLSQLAEISLHQPSPAPASVWSSPSL